MTKTIGRLLAAAALLAALTLPNVAMAQSQDSTSQTSTANSGTTVDADTTTVQDDTSAADFQTKLTERVQKQKTELKTTLTKAQTARIKARCKVAQGKITAVIAKAKTLKTTRLSIYQKISEKLTNISSKLKDSGANTTELDKQITELNTQISAFKTQVDEAYQSSVDASNVNCVTDPAGFKATLESLRSDREALTKTSVGIKSYITDTIRPTLVSLKKSLSSGSQANNNGANQ